MSTVTDWSKPEAAANLEKSYASLTSQHQRSWTLSNLPPSPSDNVLDLGCGPGFLLADLASRSASAHGCDPSEAFLALARARCGSAASVCACDGTTIPFDDETFDKVYVVQVLLYCEDPLAIINECRRVLKVGGSLCLVETDWNGLVCSAPQALFEEVKKVCIGTFLDPYMGSKLTGLLRKTGAFTINKVSTFLMESHDDENSGEGNWTTNWVFTTAPRKVRSRELLSQRLSLAAFTTVVARCFHNGCRSLPPQRYRSLLPLRYRSLVPATQPFFLPPSHNNSTRTRFARCSSERPTSRNCYEGG